ncbi:MAG: flippase [Candidatus Omnitrophica bacterium]|nr:flippase [Candidatus Omnitrophota bacterium]
MFKNNSIQHLTLKIQHLLSHQGFIRYFTNTSWLFAEKVFRIVVSLFVGVWVARYLGPEKFGLLSYAQSFVALFSAIATLGLDQIVVRELVKDESRRDELLGTSFWLKVMGALATLVVIAIAINFTSNDFYTNILIFIIASGTIFQAFNIIDMYFQAKVMGKYIALANSVSLFVGSLFKIALIIYNAPLITFAIAFVFDSFVLALGYIYFYVKNLSVYNLFNFKFRKETAIALLKDSWPLILSGLVTMIYMRIDQVMIKEMLNAEAVGQYAAAVRISEAWYFIPMVISSSLFPAIINAKKQSEELYYARLQRLYDLMVWIAISVALPMTFLSDWVVNLLYGEEYSQAGKVLMIHIWAGVFTALLIASGKWFIAENLQYLAFRRNFIGMTINVILNFILIPIYGIIGAAISTLISQLSAAYISDLFNKKTRIMFKMKTRSLLMINIFHFLEEKN